MTSIDFLNHKQQQQQQQQQIMGCRKFAKFYKLFNGTINKTVKESLRKHAYSNILKILPPNNENFQTKILIFFKCLLKTEPPRRVTTI